LVSKRGGAPAAAVVLGAAALLLLGAFVAIVEVIRPRLPRPGGGAGWTQLLGLDQAAVDAHFRTEAADLAHAYGHQARVLANIALRKFRLVSHARALILAAVPVAVTGGVLFVVGA